jgi:hypothetical protein
VLNRLSRICRYTILGCPSRKAGNLTIEPIHTLYYAKLANCLCYRKGATPVFEGLWAKEACDQAGDASTAILPEGVDAGAAGGVFEAAGGGLLVRIP